MSWADREGTTTWASATTSAFPVRLVRVEACPRVPYSRVAPGCLTSLTEMPAASKSRRRRAPSSDIEEDDPSQRHADDVDNNEDSEEDVQPVRKKATVKKEKKPKIHRRDTEASAAGPSNTNNNDDNDDDDDRIDIQNFHDQPLDKKEGAKLHGIAQDWEMIRKQIHQSSFRLVKDVAISLADVMEVGEAGEVGTVISAILSL